jgi:hypothetical protein
MRSIASGIEVASIRLAVIFIAEVVVIVGLVWWIF